MLERIATIFEIDPAAVSIEYGDEELWSNQTGIALDDRGIVAQIREDLLDDKVRIATHIVNCFSICLFEESLGITPFSEEDINPIYEMFSVWCGFGPMIAESAIRSSSYVAGGSEHWQMSRLGTMSATEVGYAMAVLHYLQSKPRPEWANGLTIDAKESLSKGLKYLQKTGDCLVNPVASCRQWDQHQIEQATKSKFASQRLLALRCLPANEVLDANELDWTLHATSDKDNHVRLYAFHLLQYAETIPEVTSLVEKGLQDLDVNVQAECIKAAGIHGHEMPGVDHFLKCIFEQGSTQLSVIVAATLTAIGHADQECISLILSRIKTSMVKGHEDASSLMVILEHLVDDPRQTLLEFLGDDEDLRADAELLFPEAEANGRG